MVSKADSSDTKRLRKRFEDFLQHEFLNDINVISEYKRNGTAGVLTGKIEFVASVVKYVKQEGFAKSAEIVADGTAIFVWAD